MEQLEIHYTCDNCGKQRGGFPVYCYEKRTFCGACFEHAQRIPVLAYVVGGVVGIIIYTCTDWGLIAAIAWGILGIVMIDKWHFRWAHGI